MPDANRPLEIAHILFMDVVAYSKMLNNEQIEVLEELKRIVLGTGQVRAAKAADQLILLPTGDGMILVFRNSPEAPSKCALEIAAALKGHPKIKLRMGVHSGPVNQIVDVNHRANFAGAALNIAQRIMDCGDAGHILLSKRIADDLAPNREWNSYLHELGEVTVKHGLKVSLFSLHTPDAGNPAVPEKLRSMTRAQKAPARRRTVLASMFFFGALALCVASWFYFGRKNPSIPSQSIAVLPLENLSDDKSDAFFAVGLQDDVVTRLTRIKGLKVIPRRWVVQYDPKIAPNLSEIRKVFGVAHVLVGNVRRDRDHLLVSVQLIDTATGQHIWAEPYDRTLADSISLQGELASEIAGRLRVILNPAERDSVRKKATNNPDAWVLYLRGRDIQLRPETARENYLSAVSVFREAVTLDPGFVLALAQLSLTQGQLYQFFERENAALLVKARENAEEALRLDPNSAEGHVARARCAQLAGDYNLTRSDLAAAVALRPDDSAILLAAASTQQQLGWEKEAAENYKRAIELGPRDPRIYLNHGYLLYQSGQEAEARWALDHALFLEPDSVYIRLVRAVAEISWTGETARARAILKKLPAGQDPDGRVTSAYCTLAILERNFPEALRLLREYPGETLPTVDTGGLGQQDRKTEAEGTIRLFAGDRAGAYEYLDSVRWQYEVGVGANPESAIHHAALALLYAWMDWKEPATAEAARALELDPSTGGAVKRGVTLGLAKAYAWAGEPDLALKQIEQFFGFRRSDYTVNNFRLDPVWDPLRSDPRFEELLAKQ